MNRCLGQSLPEDGSLAVSDVVFAHGRRDHANNGQANANHAPTKPLTLKFHPTRAHDEGNHMEIKNEIQIFANEAMHGKLCTQ